MRRETTSLRDCYFAGSRESNCVSCRSRSTSGAFKSKERHSERFTLGRAYDDLTTTFPLDPAFAPLSLPLIPPHVIPSHPIPKPSIPSNTRPYSHPNSPLPPTARNAPPLPHIPAPPSLPHPHARRHLRVNTRLHFHRRPTKPTRRRPGHNNRVQVACVRGN